jgi:hypothetical protein
MDLINIVIFLVILLLIVKIIKYYKPTIEEETFIDEPKFVNKNIPIYGADQFTTQEKNYIINKEHINYDANKSVIKLTEIDELYNNSSLFNNEKYNKINDTEIIAHDMKTDYSDLTMEKPLDEYIYTRTNLPCQQDEIYDTKFFRPSDEGVYEKKLEEIDYKNKTIKEVYDNLVIDYKKINKLEKLENSDFKFDAYEQGFSFTSF